MEVNYVQQDEPGGLAHAVKVARSALGDEPFVMYLGDNLLEEGIGGAMQAFHEERADAVVMLKEVANPGAFGVAVLDGNGRVQQLLEKPEVPPSNLALVGVYVFAPSIHDAIESIRPSKRNELEITDAIQQLMATGGKVLPRVLRGWWLDTGKKDDLLEANYTVFDTYCQRKVEAECVNTSIAGRMMASKGSRLTNYTVRGPAVIGERAVIESSFVGSHTSIGSDCRVAGSAIQHSVVLDGSVIENVDRREDSLIGCQVRVAGCPGERRVARLLLSDSSEVEL